MAQLPPRSPGVAPEWAAAAVAQSSSSWLDDFLQFSTSKRRSHRRSVSDSVAFMDDHDNDDDQLMLMLTDETGGLLMPMTEKEPVPSDRYRINEKAMEQQEEAAESSDCQEDGLVTTSESERIADPKRVKRILANRQSAQRSRVRKLHYISELERSVTSLQAEVLTLSPRVAFLDHQRSLLTMGNSHLKQRIAALAQDNIFKDAHQEALKKEVERLRMIYQEQSIKANNMEEQSSGNPSLHFEKDLFSCEDAAAVRSAS